MEVDAADNTLLANAMASILSLDLNGRSPEELGKPDRRCSCKRNSDAGRRNSKDSNAHCRVILKSRDGVLSGLGIRRSIDANVLGRTVLSIGKTGVGNNIVKDSDMMSKDANLAFRWICKPSLEFRDNDGDLGLACQTIHSIENFSPLGSCGLAITFI